MLRCPQLEAAHDFRSILRPVACAMISLAKRS
jgi:hypothetical protein